MAPENKKDIKDKKKKPLEIKIGTSANSNNVTHIYLNDKDLKQIPKLKSQRRLRVLFLHNNQITCILGLEHLTSLTNLYLQWNKIKKIECLNTLVNLEKLYLGFNEIQKLENVEKLTRLKDLQLCGQRLPEDVEFEFDERSLEAIGISLETLNIEKLNLKNLNCLSELRRIKVLQAAGNKFERAEDISSDLEPLVNLQRLDLHGCPAQKNDVHYRDKIIAACYRLENLDEKLITQYNRIFIKELGKIRTEKYKRKEMSFIPPSDDHPTESNVKNVHSEVELKFPENDFFDSKNGDELGYMPWDSLNSVKKKLNNRKSQVERVESDYSIRVNSLTDVLE